MVIHRPDGKIDKLSEKIAKMEARHDNRKARFLCLYK